MRQWRLIYDHPTTGAMNMAVDEAILSAVSSGKSLPTLRLYAWWPPCLSLGYGQKSSDVDFKRLAAQGWDIVRRPTGGRAILHGDEVTYCVTLPIDDPLAAGSVIDSYRRISHALVAGLRGMGLQAQAEQRSERIRSNGPVCFETPSHYEITVQGRKLIGSAQARRKQGILQHGSLPLYGDLARICDTLVYPDETAREQAKAQVRGRAITLAEALGKGVDWQATADGLVQGFAETFRIEFETGILSAIEQAQALQRVSNQPGIFDHA